MYHHWYFLGFTTFFALAFLHGLHPISLLGYFCGYITSFCCDVFPDARKDACNINIFTHIIAPLVTAALKNYTY